MLNNISAIIVWSIFLILLSACDRLEIEDSYYVSYEDLSKSEEPGNWVPAFIPHSAVEIKERHKIDTGAELLIFSFENYTDLSLSGFCEKVAPKDIVLPPPGFLNVRWWPDSLFQNNETNLETLDKYDFYMCERQAFLAVSQVTNRFQVFYWRISFI